VNGCQHTTSNPNCAARCAGITCTPMICGVNECNANTNPGQCAFTPTNCANGLQCTVNPRCVNNTCLYDERNCDDSNACTVDTCSEGVPGNCVHTPINASVTCDSFDACLIDLCDPTIGCYHENVTCTAPDVCHTAACADSQGGCYAPYLDCTTVPEIQALLKGGCYVSSCSVQNGGCALQLMENHTVDSCGKCNGDGSTCAFDTTGTKAAALGGLAIAAIVVIVIALAAAIALLAGQKGYEIWAKGHQALSGAQYNPGYDAGNLTGKNPLYDAPGVEMK